MKNECMNFAQVGGGKKSRRRLVFLLLAFCLTEPARADESTNKAGGSEASIAVNSSERTEKKYSVRLTYLTSRAGGKDFRSFKSSGSDDSGSMNENSVMPNLNYISARAVITPLRGHQIMFGGLQSLDSAQARIITKPNGRKFPLPGEIFSLRYVYSLSRHYTLSAGETYIDTFKFSDPTLGLNYRNSVDSGWGQRVGLGLSLPTTEKSHNERLITRATIRTGASLTADRFVTSAGLSYSRPIYSRPGDLPSMRGEDGGGATAAPGASQPSPGGRRTGRHGGGGTSGNVINADPTPASLEEVDLVIMEREVDRSTGSIGLTFIPSQHWKLGTGAGITYLETARQKAIWLTSARLIGAAYTFGKAEIGSDLQLYSDIHKYQHAALPRLWSIGLHLSYFLGDQQKTGI